MSDEDRHITFPKKSIIDAKPLELAGKKWFWSQDKISLQCAYCLFVQQITAVRESGKEHDITSIVIGFRILDDHEVHNDGCPQK